MKSKGFRLMDSPKDIEVNYPKKGMKRNIFVGALGLLLLAVSCKQEASQPLSPVAESELKAHTEGEPISFELGAEILPIVEEIDFDEVADESRNLNYKVVTKNGKPYTELQAIEEKPLYSLCVIAPKTGATDANTYYCKIKWEKKKGQNYFYAKVDDAKNTSGVRISLDPKKSWRICGVLTYTEANVGVKAVSFNPNRTFGEGVELGKNKVVKDIPLYFDWQDLPVTRRGDGVLRNPKNVVPARIKVKPLGAMVRVSVTNHADFAMRVKSMTVKSNGLLAGAGYVGWSEAGKNPVNTPITKAFFHSAGGEAQDVSYPLTGVGIDLAKDETAKQSYLLWVFPKDLRANQTEKKYTKVMVSAKRVFNGQEKEYPKMDHLYGFWSTTNNIQAGKRHHVPVTLYRKKMALEYLSNGYMQGNGSARFGEQTNFYPTAEDYRDRLKVPAGYRKLRLEDARSLMAVSYPEVNFRSTSRKEVTMGPSTHLGGQALTHQYKDIYQNGNPSIFALRYDDGEGAGKRLHYSAYQYESGNPGQLKAVYLGPNFKGTIDDINAAFVNSHGWDVVKRVFAKTSSGPARLQGGIIYADLMMTHLVRVNWSYTMLYLDHRTTRDLASGISVRENQADRKVPVVLIQTSHAFPD